ncbi:MAG: hypothetical protein ACUVYA_05720 [Planctomycetota bacterium]
MDAEAQEPKGCERADPGGHTIPRLEELPPARVFDPVVEAYKKGLDRSLLRQNLALSVEERLQKLQDFVEFLEALRPPSRRDAGGGRRRG